jgi:glycosyltransferase involved in cell wall biosynthesis
MNETNRTPVLFIISALGIGGAETQVVDLAITLDRRFKPIIVCTKRRGEQAERAEAAGVEVINLDTRSGYDPRLLLRLIDTMRRVHPTIVHCTNFNSTAWGRLAAILAHVPNIIIAEHSTQRTRITERIAVPICNRLFGAMTDAVVACGHNQAEVLVGEGNRRERIRVIVNGVDPENYSATNDSTLRRDWGVPEGRVIVGMVAQLRPEKNHLLLFRAAKALCDTGVDVHFVLVGKGPCRGKLERAMAEMDLVTHVTFLGQRLDVPRVLTGFDVVVLASVIEAFPLSMLEAMAAGRPVVATDVGDVSHIVVDGVTGFVVGPQDETAFIDRLRLLVCDPELRIRMGVAGRRRVIEEFTRAQMTRTYESLFDEFMAEK